MQIALSPTVADKAITKGQSGLDLCKRPLYSLRSESSLMELLLVKFMLGRYGCEIGQTLRGAPKITNCIYTKWTT